MRGSKRAASVKSAGEVPAEEKGLNLPFEPITLTFNDLHYYVPNPGGSGELELLKGIYGVFRPGVLTALMGASGAGKVCLACFLPCLRRLYVLCARADDRERLRVCAVSSSRDGRVWCADDTDGRARGPQDGGAAGGPRDGQRL